MLCDLEYKKLMGIFIQVSMPLESGNALRRVNSYHNAT
jgi:hypothetical protein